MLLRRLALASAALTVLGSGVAMAQDYTLQPTYGEITLETGFTPDPHSVELTAGGPINAAQANLAPGCLGMIANAPDYRLHYTAGTTYDLFIGVLADADTTLVINGPDAEWYCSDDDGDGLNPLVTFDAPMDGQYDIWVGTYGDGGNASATLVISELGVGGDVPPTPDPTPEPTPPTATVPNPDLEPTFGAVTVQAGIPVTPVDLNAGGEIDAFNVDDECRGYIAEAPDFRVEFQNLAGILPLIIRATSEADTTLVVMGPSGDWFCNDDANESLNPEVRIDSPVAGTYNIWVGTYGGAGDYPEATLTVETLTALLPTGTTK